ncbi:aquaporin-8-like [Patiria miniata]|uniref:Aquaporin n=1 Tax=Patiria miniata TaxID=46514 RepID=A0A914AY71_PATMI|nr:aquaporin-8-like [Patiria miniata]
MSGRDPGKIDMDDDQQEERTITTFEKYVQSTFAELVGTMFFTFIACLAVTTQDLVAIAFAEGLAMALLCSAFLNISGGIFNPALTFAVCLCGGISPLLAVLYFVVQICGGMLGAAFVKAVLLEDSYYDIRGGCNKFRGSVPYDKYDSLHVLGVSPGTAVIIEAMLSLFVYMSYLQANMDNRGKHLTGPLAYGFSITVGILTGMYSSGASFNPARTFGPAVASGYWDEQYIYWAGPVMGGLLAGAFYRFILGDSNKRLIMRD